MMVKDLHKNIVILKEAVHSSLLQLADTIENCYAALTESLTERQLLIMERPITNRCRFSKTQHRIIQFGFGKIGWD